MTRVLFRIVARAGCRASSRVIRSACANGEKSRFLFLGKSAVAVALGFLVLLCSLAFLSRGHPLGCSSTTSRLMFGWTLRGLIHLVRRAIESLADGDFDGVVRDALYEALGGPTGRKAKRQARKLIFIGIRPATDASRAG